ncbi:chromosome segregation protein SMC [Zymobacter sp. IVIA_12111.31 C1]|uniref:chromosome segregation protein SMC n=1 Tax=Zymobacter sp. IVIA_12111.31 C1 TaxID=3394854 RepID=UPI0039C48EC6
MRLTSIRLAGFKSFVDPVTVPFEGNMTCIVGPNGCGKSNVIDAVRWVMGESSAKMLRGESMADVIFNGSTGRKPVGQASIELTFDNSDGSLGGMYAQYAELSVKRIVTRDGQSTYFFNGEKCRRRDIADLFMGTGLGPRSYAIIGQGMISRLVEARPDELRATLEEAAGISRYKERRKETEQRMRRTRDNLERLDDLREELDRQLERLKRQADAARRYRDLKEQEHRLKGELALLRRNAWRARQQEAESQVRALEITREKNIHGIRECERLLEEHRFSHDGLAESLDEHQRRFSDTTATVARLEQQLEYARTRERQLAAELERVQQEKAEFDQLASTDQLRQQEIEERLEALALDREEAAEMMAQLELEQAELGERQQQAQAAWERIQQQSGEQTRGAERAQGEVRRLEEQRADIDRQHQQRQQQLAEVPDMALLDEELAELDLIREQDAEQLQQLEEERQRLREQRQQLNDTQQWVQKERETLLTRQNTLLGERSSLQALLAAALDHDDQQRQHALTAAGLDQAPLLAERLSVEPGWEAAVSWVLAPWLDARVASIDALNQLALEKGELGVIDDRVTTPTVGSLAAVVQGAGGLTPWLNGIRAVDEDADAWSQAATLTDGESLITRSGLWIGHGWARRLGEQARDDSVMAQRRRLDDIDAELAQLDAQLEAMTTQLSDIAARQQSGDDRLEQLHEEAARHTEQSRQHEAAWAGLSSRVQHLKGRREELTAELMTLAERREENALALEESRERWQMAIDVAETSAAAREQQASERQQANEAWQHLQTRLAPARERQSQLALEAQRLTTELEGMQRTQARGADQRQRLDERYAALQEEREALIEPQEMLKAQLDDYLDQRTREEAALTAVRDRTRQLAEQMRDSEQKRQQFEKDQEQLRTQIETLRLQVQEHALKADAQEEQLVELGLELTALMQQLPEDASESAWQNALEETSARIKRLGAINLAAIEEYEQQAERRNYLEAQHSELTDALDTLEKAIRKIDHETRTRFRATFEEVNRRLGELFPRVFGGGAAWLTLTGDDLLETGVAIMARPPGKKNSTIHLLSGGEKTMTALSLVFAIFQLNPAPFCMLDEVDAPLDDANVGRYARLVRDMSATVQFIYITHNKIAMEASDRLMGVTMQEPGVSRLVAVDIEAAAALAEA